MTPIEIMAELLAARQESAATRQETARAMEIMAQAVVGLARGATRATVGMRVVPAVLGDHPLTRTFSRLTHPPSPRLMSL